MAKLDVTVQVSKEAYELGQGVVGIVAAVKKALDDGWDLSEDLPSIVTAAVAEVGPMVEGLDQLDDEFGADPGAFAKALGLGVADVADLFLAKDQKA